MVYVDETGNEIMHPDLTLGYLVDAKWVDHPAVSQQGHYVYTNTDQGGILQAFVVDVPASPAWREVTVQKYVLFTEDELLALKKSDYAKRLDVLEENSASHDTLLTAIKEGINDA